tara:strand:+ start:3438 stop:3806 length:369 start_codon:yes stop_codon:yes gene_type:complete
MAKAIKPKEDFWLTFDFKTSADWGVENTVEQINRLLKHHKTKIQINCDELTDPIHDGLLCKKHKTIRDKYQRDLNNDKLSLEEEQTSEKFEQIQEEIMECDDCEVGTDDNPITHFSLIMENA